MNTVGVSEIELGHGPADSGGHTTAPTVNSPVFTAGEYCIRFLRRIARLLRTNLDAHYRYVEEFG